MSIHQEPERRLPTSHPLATAERVNLLLAVAVRRVQVGKSVDTDRLRSELLAAAEQVELQGQNAPVPGMEGYSAWMVPMMRAWLPAVDQISRGDSAGASDTVQQAVRKWMPATFPRAEDWQQ